jgi:hypothetical protein
LQFKVSGYYNHLTDIIERVTFDTKANTYNKYFNNLSIGIRNENIGVQNVKGFNTEVNYGISDKLDAYAYYCYTDGIEETSAGNVNIPRISQNKAWIGATYTDLFDCITVSPRFRWIGDMNNGNKIAYPTGKQQGYTSLDLSLSVNRILGFMKFYVQINNLLNQKIYNGGLYEQAGGHLAAIPEEGLHVQLGLQVNLLK